MEKINVKELNDNVFETIGKEWMLVCAGNKDKFNMMTASWGCLAHVEQIKMAMGISGMAVSTSGWFSKGKEQKAQIDLVLDRADHIVNLCEIKFSTRPYTIDKQYAETLQNRQWIFEQETKTRKSCQQVMLTTYGLAKNQYSSIIQRELTMEDLFH